MLFLHRWICVSAVYWIGLKWIFTHRRWQCSPIPNAHTLSNFTFFAANVMLCVDIRRIRACISNSNKLYLTSAFPWHFRSNFHLAFQTTKYTYSTTTKYVDTESEGERERESEWKIRPVTMSNIMFYSFIPFSSILVSAAVVCEYATLIHTANRFQTAPPRS